MLLRLRFQVTPRGKERARVGPRSVYTPEQTRNLEEQIRAEAISQLNRLQMTRPVIAAPEPVFLVTTYHLARPKGRSVYTRQPFPTCKPDLSNMTKLLEDALTGVLWTDDRQIVDNHESKRWATEKPGIDLLVADLDGMAELFPSGDDTATPTPWSAFGNVSASSPASP